MKHAHETENVYEGRPKCLQILNW